MDSNLIIKSIVLCEKIDDSLKKLDKLKSKLFTDIYNQGIEVVCKPSVTTMFQDLDKLSSYLESYKKELMYTSKLEDKEVKRFIEYLKNKK